MAQGKVQSVSDAQDELRGEYQEQRDCGVVATGNTTAFSLIEVDVNRFSVEITESVQFCCFLPVSTDRITERANSLLSTQKW